MKTNFLLYIKEHILLISEWDIEDLIYLIFYV